MKKNLLVFILIFILSACGTPATPILESTEATPPAATTIPPSTATLLPGETQPSANPYGITNNLDKFVAMPDGYILYGNISWTDPLVPPYGTTATLASIKDANGKDIPFEYADAGVYPAQGELRQYWAYKLKETNFATPLSLTFIVVAYLPVDGGSFTFDPGSNPQLGQKWDINQDVIVNNETIHILSAEEAGIEEGYFLFTMQSDSNIVDAAITDLAHPPFGGGGGGGGTPEAGAPFRSGFGYQTPLPQGPYTLTFTNVGILVPGDWSLTWSPFSPTTPPVSPTPLLFTDPSIPISERIIHYYFVTAAENPLPEGSVVVMPDTYILAPTLSDLTYSHDTAADLGMAVKAALHDDRNGWTGSNLEIVDVTFRDGHADVVLQGEYFGVGDVTLIAARTQILMTVFANPSVQTASVTLNGDTIGNMGVSNSLHAKPADYVFTREEIEEFMNEHAYVSP